MINDFENILAERITALLRDKGRVNIAIDGRCASGKTTLANRMKEILPCNVISTDCFFLPPELRTDARYNTPGGNFHRERFIYRVARPLSEGREFEYCPFDCKTGRQGEGIFVPISDVNIIEGSYSCHPELFDMYDLHVFLTVDPSLQLKRIEKRNGVEMAKVFRNKWIPLEERYFSTFSIEKRCELVFDTGEK